MPGDSHTAYPAHLGACAFGAACTIAAALTAGIQAQAQSNASAWAAYDRDQLEKFLDLSELLREHQTRRAEKAEEALRKEKLLALKRHRGLAPA